MISKNPRDYGVPHDEFYETQIDAIGRILAKAERNRTRRSFTIIEAPTGTGKTAIAAALMSAGKVTALVNTLNLLDQYRREYQFAGIKGRQNYPCAHKKKIVRWQEEDLGSPTAYDCHFGKMHKCPHSEDCRYLQVKLAALASQKLVVTYAYASLSYKIRERGGFLVMDECHLAAETLLSLAEFTISRRRQRQRGYPKFPDELWLYGERKKGGALTESAQDILIEYLAECTEILEDQMQYMSALEKDFARLQKEHQTISQMITNLPRSDWFLDCHAYVSFYRGQNEPGLRLRALDARTVADRLWEEKTNVVMMSATISEQSAENLADKIGIEDYEYINYPHRVPVSSRPVIDLGVKRMTHKNLSRYPNMYRAQAAAIASWIETLDPAHRGIVLTSSYKKIEQMAAGLEIFLPERRLIVQRRGQSIDEISKSFITDVQPGDLLIASIQGFGHGLDLKGDLARFSVIAGVPHDNPTDPYIQALKGQAGGANYLWSKTYAAVPQAAGRVSRAARVNGDYLTNWTAIADGSALTPTAKRFYPEYFLEAIEKRK